MSEAYRHDVWNYKNQLILLWIPYLFCGCKVIGFCVDHPPSSGAKVKETVQLHISIPVVLRGLL
jgi:hypothetical protein